VAAVARHVDDLAPGRHVLQLVEVVDLHAVVDAVPEGGEHEGQRAHHRMRIVGGDLPGVAVGLAPGLGRGAAVALGGVGDGAAHRLGVEHAVHQQAAGGEVRPDDGLADAAEVHAQHPRGLAHHALVRQAVAEDLAHREAGREAHQGVAAVEQDGEQPAEAADQRPVLREQHREPAALPLRGAADQDRDRHQLHVLLRVEAMRHQQPRQGFRVAAVGRPAERALAPARERHVGATSAQRIAGQRSQRRGQAGLAAGAVEDQHVRQPVVLQHVADRAVELDRRHHGVAGQFDPGVQHGLEQARPPGRTHVAGQGACRVHGRIAQGVAAAGAAAAAASAAMARRWDSTASARYQPPSMRTIGCSNSTTWPSNG